MTKITATMKMRIMTLYNGDDDNDEKDDDKNTDRDCEETQDDDDNDHVDNDDVNDGNNDNTNVYSGKSSYSSGLYSKPWSLLSGF